MPVIRTSILISFLSAIVLISSFGQSKVNGLSFSQLPDIPPPDPTSFQQGLAGSFAGIHHGILIIAGGTNFPESPPCKGGEKKWWREIYIMEKDKDQSYHWLDRTFQLPVPLAYGVSVSTDEGLLVIGGNNADSCSRNVYLLSWDEVSREIKISEYPPLPVPLAHMTGCRVNDAIYLAGGQEVMEEPSATKHFFRLELDQENKAVFQWEILPPWHGKPRGFAVSAAQSNGVDPCFYLFSGRNYGPGMITEVLQDGFLFNPRLNEWKMLAGTDSRKFQVMAGEATGIGISHILFFGGSDGMQKEADSLFIHHPGFCNKVLAYNTITNQLFPMGEMPFPPPVTTTLVTWDEGYILPGGEIRPGVRTAEVWRIDVTDSKRSIGFFNSMVLLVYFLVLIGIGTYFSRRQKSTNDYFRGGNRVPWWVMGLSLFGTALSAITFIAIPAKSFTTDWSYIFINVGILLVAPVVIFFFIPFFRRLNVVTAYEYLEQRFNVFVRLLGSVSFILFHIGRIGIVLFLPSLALHVATGIDTMTLILVVGIVSIIYTIIGGIEAVIWTDALQVVILFGGALFSVFHLSSSHDSGMSGLINEALADGKLKAFDLAFDLKNPTFLVVLVGGFFAQFILYCTDQTMVQRYMTTKTKRDANKSVLLNAILTIPVTLIFFLIGTALYVFFKNMPAEMNLKLDVGDAVFPWYIFHNLPAGLSGLLIAGILAAAMSTLSSSINSGATAYYTDIQQRLFHRGGSNQSIVSGNLTVPRIAALLMGLLGTLFAIILASMDIMSLWDEFQKVLGLIIGGLGGVFILGIFSGRANSPGAIAGIIGSAVVQYLLSLYQAVHLLLFSATGVISCVVIGLFVSYLTKPKEHIDHLVIWKVKKQN